MYQLRSEGRIGGVHYVTVLDEGFNPIEYNVELEYAAAEYGIEV